MEKEILEARSLHKALRKVFGLEANEDILSAAREIQKQVMRMKKELHASQEERREAKETLKRVLEGRIGSISLGNDPPRRKRR